MTKFLRRIGIGDTFRSTSTGKKLTRTSLYAEIYKDEGFRVSEHPSESMSNIVCVDDDGKIYCLPEDFNCKV